MVRVNAASGHLEPPCQVLDHNPSPVQDCGGAHIHQVVLGGADRGSLEVLDLGSGSVSHYATSQQLIETPALQVVAMPQADSGPRHLVVHPSAPWAFVVNELDSTLSSLPYSHLTGDLGAVTATVSTLRRGENSTDMAGGGQ